MNNETEMNQKLYSLWAKKDDDDDVDDECRRAGEIN